MHKIFVWVLVFSMACGISNGTAFASTGRAQVRAEKLKAQLDYISDSTVLNVKLKDHSQVRGKLVARSEEGFDLAPPKKNQSR